MKTRFCILILSVGLILGARAMVRADSPATTQSSETNAGQPGNPINHFCPIHPDNPVDDRCTIQWQGKCIGFCCPDCIAPFEADPDKYLATMK